MYPQDNKKDTFDHTLEEVLNILENRYDVRFSYGSNVVDNQFVAMDPHDLELEDILEKIETILQVRFEKVSDRFYILYSLEDQGTISVQRLEEVIVPGYIRKGIDKQSDGSFTISPAVLEIVPGLTEPDILESLQLLPGVQSPSETASDLFIRGGSPDQNLVLWDGIPIYDSGHFFGALSIFNPYVTETSKLIKNGPKARYGNRISGVLDISSKNGIPEKTKMGFGSNMTHADAYLNTPLGERVSVLLSVRRSLTDFLDTPTFTELSDRAFQNLKFDQKGNVFVKPVTSTSDFDFHFLDLAGKAVYEPSPKNKITASLIAANNDLYHTYGIQEYSENSENRLRIQNRGLGVQWNARHSKKVRTDVSLSYADFDLSYSGETDFSGLSGEVVKKQNQINDFTLQSLSTLKLNDSNEVSLGYEYNFYNLSYGISKKASNGDGNYDKDGAPQTHQHSLILEYNLKSQKWSGDFGVRGGHYTLLNKVRVEPRVHLTRKFGRGISTKLSYDRRTQAISQILEFDTPESGFDLESQLWVLANGDDVPLLQSDQFSIGVLYNRGNWILDLDLYYKGIDGITSFTRGFNNLTTEFTNGKGRIMGVEFLLHRRIKNYRTWISYTYNHNRIKLSSSDLNYHPSNADIPHAFDWSNSLKIGKFQFAMQFKYRSGTPYTLATGIDETSTPVVVQYGAYNAERLSDYHRLDVSATYNFNLGKTTKAKVGASLINVYNQKNVLNRSFNTQEIYNEATGEPLGHELLEANDISLGITPNIVFRIDWR